MANSFSLKKIPVSKLQEQRFFEKYGIEVLSHLPSSLDLAPCDFWLFPALKTELRGYQFCSNAAATAACTIIFSRWLKEEFRKTMLVKWSERWQECILHEGRYFEKE